MAKIVIIGVGALGSHVAQFLRHFDLKVVDHDRVEQKNVLSQFHARNSVGKNKTLALQQSLNFLWGVQVETIPHKLVQDNVKQLFDRSQLIIDCLDNGEARRIVQNYVRKEGFPCLHGALAADGALGRVVWDEDFQIDDDSAGGATCEDGEHLPFIGMTACYIARCAQEYLKTGKKLSFQVYPRGAAIRI